MRATPLGSNAAEIDRIQHQWRARELLVNMNPREDPSQFGELTRRSFAYEKKLRQCGMCEVSAFNRISQGRSPLHKIPYLTQSTIAFRLDATYGRVFASRTHSKSSSLERAPSHLGPRRSNKGEPGALALHARWFQLPGKSVVHGASTCVTRSIGDWDSSRALIPQPEVVRRIVKRGPSPCRNQENPPTSLNLHRRREKICSCIGWPLGDTKSQDSREARFHARSRSSEVCVYPPQVCSS